MLNKIIFSILLFTLFNYTVIEPLPRKNAMPRTECIVYRQYDNKTSTYKPTMYCNKTENEHCDRDDECFSHKCLHSKENSTRYYCGPENYNENKYGDICTILIVIAIFAIIVIIFRCLDGGGSGSGSGGFYFDSYSGGGGCDCG
eukprot:jgi/Orpsp1_1/1182581/evm.model.c7180000081888.2